MSRCASERCLYVRVRSFPNGNNDLFVDEYQQAIRRNVVRYFYDWPGNRKWNYACSVSALEQVGMTGKKAA